MAATRGKKLKDATLLSLKTKRGEAGSLLAGAEARRRGAKGELTALRKEQELPSTTVATVPDPLDLVDGAVGGMEASCLPVALGENDLRVTAASPTRVVVGISNQEMHRPESGQQQTLSPLETEALVALECNRRKFRMSELRMRANDWRGSASLLAASDVSLDKLVCSPLFGSLPDSMRVELEKASLQNTLQRLMSKCKLGDWLDSDELFDRASSFNNTITATERTRLTVLKARRCLYLMDYGECIRLCNEAKTEERRTGLGNQSGYLDSLLKNCLEAQRAGV